MKYFYIALISLILIVACSKEKEEEIIKNPHEGMNMNSMNSEQKFENPSSNITLDGEKLTFENVEMQIPAHWIKETPSSSMRVIQFFSKDNKDAIIAGFFFGNRPNMTDENIDRWKSQFVKVEKVNKKEFANGKALLVEIDGTYKKRPSEMVMEFEEAPNYKTIAAIISTDNGPYFFKMVAPKNIADKELKNFESFLATYKTK